MKQENEEKVYTFNLKGIKLPTESMVKNFRITNIYSHPNEVKILHITISCQEQANRFFNVLLDDVTVIIDKNYNKWERQ